MSGSNEHSGSAPEEYGECGPGGVNGLRVITCGQTAVARRDDLLDGRCLQRRDRATEQRKLKERADGTRRWAVSYPRGYGVRAAGAVKERDAAAAATGVEVFAGAVRAPPP
jgi:hypothetical protein